MGEGKERNTLLALSEVLEEIDLKMGGLSDYYVLEDDARYRERFNLVPLKEWEVGVVATTEEAYRNKMCFFLFELIYDNEAGLLRVRATVSYNKEFRMMHPWKEVSFEEASAELERQKKLIFTKVKAELIELSLLF
jgi:hypothetical protein